MPPTCKTLHPILHTDSYEIPLLRNIPYMIHEWLRIFVEEYCPGRKRVLESLRIQMCGSVCFESTLGAPPLQWVCGCWFGVSIFRVSFGFRVSSFFEA